MRILFASKLIEDRNLQPLGIYPISATLKKDGHKTHLVDAVSEQAVEEAIDSFRPHVLAISTPTARYRFFQKMCEGIKKRHPELLTVFGGIHVTMLPESIYDQGIDAVCRGEGDHAFPAFINRLESGGDTSTIQGIWTKDHGEVTENGSAPLVRDLDALPFPDRSITDHYSYCRRMPVGIFVTSRGCPYRCTFCSNSHLQEILKDGSGTFFRTMSPQRAIDEVRDAVDRYRFRRLVFLNEVFSTQKNWLREFVELYLEGPNLPFWSMFYPSQIDEERAALLAKAGCTIVELGVETGNEEFRRNELKRPLSNDTIVRSIELLHAHGIKVQTSNILALPGGTLEHDIETLDINIRAKVDFPDVCIFQPLPKVPLEKKAIEVGYYDGNFDSLPKTINPAVVQTVPAAHPKREQVERLAYLFPLAVKSRLIRRMLPRLLEWPLRPVYLLVYKTTIAWYKLRYVYGLKKAFNLELFKIIWAYIKY